MPTITDIAKICHVAVGTVSNVLNNPHKVKPETREKVLKVIKELNFHPNLSARNLSRLKTETIALTFPFSKRNRLETYYTALLAGITEICFQMDFKLLLSQCPKDGNNQEDLMSYQKMIHTRSVDGFIFTVPKYDDRRISYLCDNHQKFVLFGRSNLDREFPWVDIDGGFGISEAVRYLSSLGHKRIGYIGTPNIFMFSRHRLEGYKNGLQICHIDFDPELVMEVSLDEDEVEEGEQEVIKLLSLHSPPKAVIVSGSQLTLGAIKGIHKFGYAIGEDISIICFDDAEWNVHFTPPITSIRQPIYEGGKLIAKILIQLIQGETIEETAVLLKPRLIIRESCKKYG